MRIHGRKLSLLLSMQIFECLQVQQNFDISSCGYVDTNCVAKNSLLEWGP
jgi:hypothetical protein